MMQEMLFCILKARLILVSAHDILHTAGLSEGGSYVISSILSS